MNVVYANPVFSDYRVPFYKELNRLFKGNFKVICSINRYSEDKDKKLLHRMRTELERALIEFKGESLLMIKKPFNKDFDAYYRFPRMKGFEIALDALKPDILLTEGFFQWTPRVVLYAWRKKIPVYICYERTAHTERFAPFFKIWQRKFTDKFVTGYFANGTETKEYLLSLGINEAKIHIGGMNADSEGLRKGLASMTDNQKKEMRDKLTLNDNGLNFLYSGKFIERKGIIYMLKAWAKHTLEYPKDSLILIGGGEKFDEYKSQFGHICSIKFVGKVPYDDVYKYYGISDVFIIPTLEDNWCLVVPEAMSTGMPIACSKYNGGARDLIIEGENGHVFDPLDDKSMLETLSFFHGKDLKAMGCRSIELERPWNTENAAKRIFEVLINVSYKERI